VCRFAEVSATFRCYKSLMLIEFPQHFLLTAIWICLAFSRLPTIAFWIGMVLVQQCSFSDCYFVSRPHFSSLPRNACVRKPVHARSGPGTIPFRSYFNQTIAMLAWGVALWTSLLPSTLTWALPTEVLMGYNILVSARHRPLTRLFVDYQLSIDLVINPSKSLCGWCWFAWFVMQQYFCPSWCFYRGSTFYLFSLPSR